MAVQAMISRRWAGLSTWRVASATCCSKSRGASVRARGARGSFQIVFFDPLAKFLGELSPKLRARIFHIVWIVACRLSNFAVRFTFPGLPKDKFLDAAQGLIVQDGFD